MVAVIPLTSSSFMLKAAVCQYCSIGEVEKDITPKDRKQCKKMIKPDTEWKAVKDKAKAKPKIRKVKVNSTN
ncbi:hypothetical protein Tco_0419491 [Tanacetum coccineum]